MNFPDTTWTILAEATLNGGEAERQALDKLCKRYWQPVASMIRARGAPTERVEDLTQDFFVLLMEGGFFRRAERVRGKFRSFLLNALRNFLADDVRKSLAAKRGGGSETIELQEDTLSWEEDELRFDLAWAEMIFHSALKAVGREVIERKGEKGWRALRGFLTATSTIGYAELGTALGSSEGAAKIEVSRLRAKFRDSLRSEVAKTVSAPHEIDEELAFLRSAMMRISMSSDGTK